MWLAIGDAVEHWARYIPNKTAIRVGAREYSFRTLYKRALSIGLVIIESGVVGRIGVGVEDKFEYLACIAALNLMGYSIIIFNPLATKESLKVHLSDTNPSLIIGSTELIGNIDFVSNQSVQTLDLSKISMIEDSRQLPKIKGKEWGVLFSSGSTGISKAIVYDHLAMTSELLAWILELGIRRDTRFYVGRPIFYTGGLVLTLATLLVGGEVFLPEFKDDQDFVSIWSNYQTLLKQVSLDLAFFVPDQIRKFFEIAKEPFLGGPTILVMGAPISGEEKKKVYEFLKSPIVESWGNSEGLGTITDKEDLFVRPNSIGRPFLTEKLCVVSDDLVECAPKQRGRLAGSEETMFVEYANRPDATNRVKKNNLILSDDIGYIDEDNYFYILGRDQESFVVNGQTVFLTDIEENLRNKIGIIESCIIAIKKDSTPMFYALVVRSPDVSEEQIKIEVEKSYSTILNSCLFVESLPRLPSGKIDRIGASKLVRF